MTIKLRFRFWFDETDGKTHLLVLDRETDEIIGHYEKDGHCSPNDFSFELGTH